MSLYFRESFSKRTLAMGILLFLAGCGEPRAVMLPLEYPDGSPVRSSRGEPVMAGYQTYGTAMHSNATALYVRAAPASCVTCAQVGTVVSEPSVFRQTTGILGASTVGAGAVMGGLGMMNYGNAALEGKVGTNVTTQNTSSFQNTASYTANAPVHHDYGYHYPDGTFHSDGGGNGYGDNNWARQGGGW